MELVGAKKQSRFMQKQKTLPSNEQAMIREFRARAMDSCANFYMTMISIIQSLALGYFATRFEGWPSDPWELPAQFLMYAIALQMIVVTWHEYSIGSIFFKWPVGFSDSWIPILLGLSEYAVLYYVSYSTIKEFCTALAIFVLLAFFAFRNQMVKGKTEPENAAVFAKLLPFLMKTRKWMILNAFLYAGISTVIWLRPSPILSGVLLLVANSTFIFHAVENKRYYGRLFETGKPGHQQLVSDPQPKSTPRVQNRPSDKHECSC